MPGSEKTLFDEEHFSGQVRLFPLPDLVMFPQVVQPLHIFEPRYRELMEDALADDKLIAMAVLAPGWEDNYEGRPAVHAVACLGRVATHERLPDGRFNLLLLGLRRVRVVKELPRDHLYRVAQVQLLEDDYPPAGESERQKRHATLMAIFRQKLEQLSQGEEQIERLQAMGMTLGTLTDLVGYTLNFEISFKTRLLLETNVDLRAEALIARLQSPANLPAGPHKFPPDFSQN